MEQVDNLTHVTVKEQKLCNRYDNVKMTRPETSENLMCYKIGSRLFGCSPHFSFMFLLHVGNSNKASSAENRPVNRDQTAYYSLHLFLALFWKVHVSPPESNR